MRRTKKLRLVMFVAAVMAIIPAGGGVGFAQAKIDITGAWVFDVQTDAGSGTPTVTFKQDGEKMAGHISSATFGEQDFTGTLKGQTLEFQFGADGVGSVVYKLTVDSNTAMHGTIVIADGAASGTITAKRKE